MEIYVNDIKDSLTPVGISQLGTLVYDNITFPAEKNGAYPEIRLDAVTMSVNRPKKIVFSSISGKSGTIKEYTGSDDYHINVSAIVGPVTYSVSQAAGIAAGLIPGVSTIAGAIGASPNLENTEILESLNKLDDFNQRVAIQCKYLQNIFDINYVIIDDISYVKSGADSWTVRMKLLSDKEIDLGRFGDGA